eukprot:3425010-Alexandrium_andersonii.AAC.1
MGTLPQSGMEPHNSAVARRCALAAFALVDAFGAPPGGCWRMLAGSFGLCARSGAERTLREGS